MVPEITEQYLKIIFKLTENGGLAKTSDMASAMDIAPASVTEMLHIMVVRKVRIQKTMRNCME